MITTIAVLSVILLVSLLVNVNQLRKQEAQADYIEDLETSNTDYYNFIQSLKNIFSAPNVFLSGPNIFKKFKLSLEALSKNSIVSF